jgi:DNA-directed RNA polymerase subunit RPC12/RpoP
MDQIRLIDENVFTLSALQCPHCGSHNLSKIHQIPSETDLNQFKYTCFNCGKFLLFTDPSTWLQTNQTIYVRKHLTTYRQFAFPAEMYIYTKTKYVDNQPKQIFAYFEETAEGFRPIIVKKEEFFQEED